MFTNFYYRLGVLLTLSLFFSGKILAQAFSEKNKAISIDSVAGFLEVRQDISIYFLPDFFKDKTFHPSLLSMPVNQIISVLKNACNCSLILIDSSSIVFDKNDLTFVNTSNESTSNSILIGNPNEYGKYSRAIINGKIIDGKTGEPLVGARIFIDKIKLGAVSDKSGQFSMVIPVGNYDAKFTYIGYEEGKSKIKVVGNGEVTFEIIEKSIGLNEVIVTSRRTDNNLLSSKMGVVQLNSKDIKELPATFGEIDIIKSATLLPGVQSVGEFGTGFNVRGGSADQNLILLEDVPIFNASHLFGLTSIINSDGVSNVTLSKAGISAKYGERASSIMDIHMGTTNSEKIKAIGGIGLINSRLTVDIPILKNKINLMVGGRTTYSDWLLRSIPDIDLKNSSAKFYDLNGLLTIAPNNNNKIVLMGYYSDDNFLFNRSANYKYGNILASIRWNHIINKKLSASLMAGLSRYNYKVSELDTFRRAESYEINSQLNYQNVKLNFAYHPTTNHAIDIGVNGVLYSIQPGNLKPYDQQSLVIPISIQKEKASEISAYASDDYNFSEKFSAEAGVRYTLYLLLGPHTYNNYRNGAPILTENITGSTEYRNNQVIKTFSGLEPRVSMRYSINDYSSVKLSYSRINQFINLVSNSSVMTPSDVWKLSDQFEKPLTSDHYSIGYFRNFNQNLYETSVEFYYKKLKNVVEYKNGAQILLNSHLETDLVNAQGYNYGAEVYVKKNSGRLTGWASYTYSRSLRKTTETYASDKINNNDYFPSSFDKPHNLVINANYHISRRWRFSGSFQYSTGRPTTLPEFKYNYGGVDINNWLVLNNYQIIYYSGRNKYRLPDFHRLDISITLDESLRKKKKWKGSWTFSIINLYGRKNAYSVFYQKENATELNNYNQYNLYKLYIVGRPLPTITYNFSF